MTYRQRGNKFRAQKTEYGGRKFDSKFEAGVARDLDLRLQAGEIAGWEPQFRIECVPYNAKGQPFPKLAVRHRVDFRIHELDGTYTLLEAKGFETDDWKRRRDWLMAFWLPEHPDHTYEVVKDRGRAWTLPFGRKSA